MAKMCVAHPSEPAITHCFQCHKPVCKSCVMVTPHGSFCSSECSIIYREFQDRFQGGKRKRAGIFMKIVAVGLFVLALVSAIHILAQYGKIQALKSADLIGEVISLFEEKAKSMESDR